MKKQIIMILVSLVLLFNNTFASGNSQFKAMFVKDVDKVINSQDSGDSGDGSDFGIESSSPILVSLGEKSNSFSLRDFSEKKSCLMDDNGIENCPSSMVQCNQKFNKSKGVSIKHKKELVVNKIEKNGSFYCPENFVPIDALDSKDSLCKKEYTYYTYECPSKVNQYDFEWKGPLVKTGADCMGECGPNGCVCNSAEAPVSNCIQEDLSCPFDDNKSCTKMKESSDTREEALPLTVFSLGSSIKVDKILKKNPSCSNGLSFNKKTNLCETVPELYMIDTREPICGGESTFANGVCSTKAECPSDYMLVDGTCQKKYSYFSYSCEKGFDTKEKGGDCNGTCEGYNCQCNPETSPENNCSLTKTDNKNEDFSYTVTTKIKEIKVSGSFNTTFKNEFFKKELPILSIKANKGELCFENGTESSCVEIKGCSFSGEEKLKERASLTISEKKIGKISSNCLVTGVLGNGVDAITTVESKDNKLIFSNNFKEVKLGELSFISKDIMKHNPIATDFVKKGFHPFTANNNSYFASVENMTTSECKTFAKNNNSTMELIFKSKELQDKATLMTKNSYERIFGSEENKCVVKYNGKADFSKNVIVKTVKKDTGYTVYGCSPLRCVDGSCQEAVCKPGFDGPIQPIGYSPIDGECQDQVCDANKAHSTYCGQTAACDVSDPSIVEENGECKQLVCEKGEFDPETKECSTKVKL